MRACKLVPEPDMRTINLVSEFAMMNSFKCYIQMLMRKCICTYVLYGGTKLASIIRPVPGTEK